MEKIRVYNPEYTQLQESFYTVLKEISEIRPQTLFTKEQEEEFLKDAIAVFEYLKSGIDIKSSEILINSGEIPISSLEKILINFSEKLLKDDNKNFTFKIYRNDEGKPTKIYEFQRKENKNFVGNSKLLLERELVSEKRKILFINADSSTNIYNITQTKLKKIIDYALKNDVILLYDATSSQENKGIENVKSIYEIEDAKKVAIEFKRFTSVDNEIFNCGYLVVPESLRFPKEVFKKSTLNNLKDMLQEEILKGKISRKSLKKSFLNYTCR